MSEHPGLLLARNGGWVNDQALPWRVDVDVFLTPISQVNWNANVMDTLSVYNARRDSSGLQNDELSFDLVLAAGTWVLEGFWQVATSRGTATALLDGASVGAMDCYAGATTENQRLSLAGVGLAAPGKRRLTLRAASKNAASTGYTLVVKHVVLRRTS